MPLNKPIRRWNEQRVWIIGASSGIGAALSTALLSRGARVALSARREDALSRLAQSAQTGRALIARVDVTSRESVEGAYARIKADWGGLDLMVLMAGNHQPMRAWDFDHIAARRLFEVNVFGPLNALGSVVPDLVARRDGAIAVVSSVAGYAGLPTSLIYGSTKAALINLAETLYLDLRPKGISVFLVCPGFVRTPLTDKNEFKMPALISSEEAARHMVRGFELGDFEIHFPKRFTRFMKLLRILPHRLFFPIVHRITGL